MTEEAMRPADFEVDPAHVATCDLPIPLCRQCSEYFRLDRHFPEEDDMP